MALNGVSDHLVEVQAEDVVGYVEAVCVLRDALAYEQRDLCKDKLQGQRKLRPKEHPIAMSGKTEH